MNKEINKDMSKDMKKDLKKFTDALNLITDFLGNIYSPECETTIRSLADNTGIPLDQARHLVSLILFSDELNSYFYFSDDSLEDIFDEEDIRHMKKSIRVGLKDDIPIMFHEPYTEDSIKALSNKDYRISDFLFDQKHRPSDFLFDQQYPFFLDPVETDLLKQNFPFMAQKENDIPSFHIKQLTPILTDKDLELKKSIEKCIFYKRKCIFRYKRPSGPEKEIICIPDRIEHDLSDQRLYLYDINNRAYRFDRIRRFNRGGMVQSDALKQDTKNPRSDRSRTHVKVKLDRLTRNLLDKIRSDIRLREETARLYEEDGFYYYEDEIEDVNRFRRWVRSYGASMTILEPVELAQKILDNALEKQRRYDLLEKAYATQEIS